MEPYGCSLLNSPEADDCRKCGTHGGDNEQGKNDIRRRVSSLDRYAK